MDELKKANLVAALEVSDLVNKRENLALDREKRKSSEIDTHDNFEKRLKTVEESQQRLEQKFDSIIAGNLIRVIIGLCTLESLPVMMGEIFT